MEESSTFCWAIKPDGKWVHVDEVVSGLSCGCICPACEEPLEARKGEINAHGFAHHSKKGNNEKERQANLDICYRVVMYKLAEHIIEVHKKIYAPAYSIFFPATTIEFTDVEVNSQYERVDKQPDVIAKTKDGKEYIIDFVFEDKVQHNTAIDYKKMNCLQIDLSNQKMETLEEFLINQTSDRSWLNNRTYFEQIESYFEKDGYPVKVVTYDDCKNCNFINTKYCSKAFRYDNGDYITAVDSCITYHFCGKKQSVRRSKCSKTGCITYHFCGKKQYEESLAKFKEDQEKERLEKEEAEKRKEKLRKAWKLLAEKRKKLLEQQKQWQANVAKHEKPKEIAQPQQLDLFGDVSKSKIEHEPITKSNTYCGRSCYSCRYNSKNLNKNNPGYANCKMKGDSGVPEMTPPQDAETCSLYSKI